jgi:chemotaxis protein MotB
MTTFQKIIRTIRPDEVDSNIWMLPFSTLMMILMILFASLYANSYLNSIEYETAIAEMTSTDPNAELSETHKELLLAKEMKEFIKTLEMENLAEVSITANAIHLKLSSPVIFESGSAELKPDIMPLLIKLLGHIKEMQNSVIVDGHTDNIPIHSHRFSSNWELSAARAFSVIYFYIKRGISPERLLAHGFGEYRPFFSNETELGRAMNRRIEITVLRGGPK